MADVIKMLDAGLAILTNLIKGSGTEPKYVAWGTGTTAATVTDTSLETASGEDRTSGTTTRQTTNTSNDTYRVVGTITSLSGQAITEVGLLDADTAGNMFMRATFDAINLNTSDSIQFTINTVFDQAA